MGYVYLLLVADADGERHKIGFTKNHPSKRVKALQTGNAGVITLLNFYESKNYQKIERWLHGRYAFQKSEAWNEWFKLTNSQIGSFIKDCEVADNTIQFMLENNPFYK